jgi:hypothetical protein
MLLVEIVGVETNFKFGGNCGVETNFKFGGNCGS